MTPAERLSQHIKATKRRDKMAKALTPKLDCKVRERRLALGLSLRDVAEPLGMAVATLWGIERGKSLRITTAFKLAKFFGVGIGDLWSELEG